MTVTHLLGPGDPGVGVAPAGAPQGDVLPLALRDDLVAHDDGRRNEHLDLKTTAVIVTQEQQQ